MSAEWEFIEENTNDELSVFTNEPKILVVGVGGAGGNAVGHMAKNGIKGVEFWAVNTDNKDLLKVQSQGVENLVLVGPETTRGLGAGGNPDVGIKAAQESIEQIRDMLRGADMVFVTAGLGGGTGTGGISIVAEEAKRIGALTVAVVTKPFNYEGRKRIEIAESGHKELLGKAHSIVIIPNDKVLELYGDADALKSLRDADEVLLGAVRGISDVITTTGIVNLDFNDVRAVLTASGAARLGTGEASGENRAIKAAEMAISSPLLPNLGNISSQNTMVNITGVAKMSEVHEVMEHIRTVVGHDPENVFHGLVHDETMGDTLKVSVFITGIRNKGEESARQSAQRTGYENVFTKEQGKSMSATEIFSLVQSYYTGKENKAA